MMGKRVGESFHIRKDDVQEKIGVIEEVRSKCKFRFNRSLEEWEFRFPDDPWLWRISIKTKPSGEPDLSETFQTIDKSAAHVEQCEKNYKGNMLSPMGFARMTNVSILEAIQHLSSRDKMPIRCWTGVNAELYPAETALKSGRPLLLDGSYGQPAAAAHRAETLAGVAREKKVCEFAHLPVVFGR